MSFQNFEECAAVSDAKKPTLETVPGGCPFSLSFFAGGWEGVSVVVVLFLWGGEGGRCFCCCFSSGGRGGAFLLCFSSGGERPIWTGGP